MLSRVVLALYSCLLFFLLCLFMQALNLQPLNHPVRLFPDLRPGCVCRPRFRFPAARPYRCRPSSFAVVRFDSIRPKTRKTYPAFACKRGRGTAVCVCGTAPHFLPFYPTIVLDTGVKVATVPDWLRKQAPLDAAAGKEYVGRLMGKVT